MQSRCGRYVIVFNGEIYNFRKLRRDMEARGVGFSTESDTEVLLSLFVAEGEAMLTKLHGMFAMVVWDRVARRAFAARDPYGIKPLYFAETADGVLFGSQVKALLATGLVSRAPCARGQAGFWMLGSVPEPYTWFRDIHALPAGQTAWVEEGRVQRKSQWFDVGAAWREAKADSVQPRAVVSAGIQQAVRESVRRHLVSDVPVGVLLSGGVDSGCIAGLMAEFGVKDMECVTLAFDEYSGRVSDETPMASAVARHYGLRHTVRRVGRAEFVADLPRILDAMDQPSVDGVNTWFAAKAVAERSLKVVVSGAGGDELFQGYPYFRTLPRLVATSRMLSRSQCLVAMIAMAGSWQARRSGNPRWCHLEAWTRTIEGAWWLRKSIRTPEELPSLMGEDLAREAFIEFDVVAEVRRMAGPLPSDPLLALGQIDSTTYLRNQLLRDSDWASMDYSVELRTPLVDAELLRNIQPWLTFMRPHSGKALLAGSLTRSLPPRVLRRRKTGFCIPVTAWLGRGTRAGRQEWQSRVAGSFVCA